MAEIWGSRWGGQKKKKKKPFIEDHIGNENDMFLGWYQEPGLERMFPLRGHGT